MSRHFEFNSSSWSSDDSRIFAEELSRSNPESRDRLSREFGLFLSFDSKGMRVDYDGKKIGFGSFNNPSGSITFSINPKIQEFDTRALFDCIEKLNFVNKIVNIKREQEVSVQEDKNSFSWTFLLGLLDDINTFGVHNFSIFNSKKTIRRQSSVRGRPIAKSLAINFGLGRFGIDCEVLDNYRQRQYATLFLATAKSALQELVAWHNTIGRSNVQPRAIFISIDHKLKPFATIPFSMRLVTELSHPPYSFGVKNLVAKCVQYWRWKGIFSTNHGKKLGSFWSVSIALDKAFELYAGHILDTALIGFEKIPKRLYTYSVDFVDQEFPSERLDRAIEPDHLYIKKTTNNLVVAEIKYSRHLAIREHVSQLISYLSYDSYSFEAQNRVGLLVYPGTSLRIEKIPCFIQNIFLVTLPVREGFLQDYAELSVLMRLLKLE